MPGRLTPAGVALFYAVFAALWIVSSGYLLTLTIDDPLLQNRIELTKGLAFVAVTSGLLYLLLRGWRESFGVRQTTVQADDVAPPKTTRLVPIFIALVLVVPLIDFAIFRLHVPRAELDSYDNLKSIAGLKAEEIENWLNERRGDAQGLAANAGFAQQVEQFLLSQKHDARLPKQILNELDSLQVNHGFDSIMLLNTGGRLLASIGEDVDIPDSLQNLLRQSLNSRQVQFSDMYHDKEGDIHMEWAVPLVISDAQGERAVAVVVLRTTAQHFIFPLIQTWPTASASGETMLLRREGVSVIYLNELRHRQDTALKLTLPLTDVTRPAVVAIRSAKPGTVQGKDYRGVQVLAAYRPVAGTEWHIVAKIDRDEVLMPVWDILYWISVSASVAVAFIMAVFLMLMRQQQRSHQLALLAHSAEVLRENERRYRAVTQSASDAIVTVDSSGNIVDWNPSIERMFGYTEAEIKGQPLTRLMPERFRDRHRESLARVASGGEPCIIGKTVELAGLRKDGEEFPLEISLAQWQTAAGRFFTGAMRDITERKSADIKIHRLTQFYSALSQCNQAIVRCTSEEELFPQICRDAVQFGGMKMAWIGLVDEASKRVKPVASYGTDTEYLEGIQISVDAGDPHGRSPVGTSIRENQPFWCRDFQHDPVNALWHERGARFGWGATASLPLLRNGIPVGSLTLYADTVNAFDEEARRLLVEMAMDISFALDNFAREAERMQARLELVDSEQRFRGLVEQSLTGIYIIQDGKLAYVNPRSAEILGQGSADQLLGQDPLQFTAEADRGKVAESIRQLHDKEAHSIALEFAALRQDGVTITVGANVSPALYHGRPAIIGQIQDISEKKRAEEQISSHVARLKFAFLNTVKMATSLSEMRDPYTAGHERRVAEIAVTIATRLGLDEQRIEGIRIAGYLHDIGKISIPAEILSKPGKLSAAEYALVQGHAQAGYDILKNVDFPWPVATVALQHHERLDGSGYPSGLKDEEILLESRIMAVADLVEAMSSHRPYRPGIGIKKALAEIERGSGTTYDPVIAHICLRLFREQGYVLPAK